MMIIRRSAAIAGLVLASLGLLACLAGAAGVWALKNRAQGVAAGVFTAADDAFDFMATRLVLVSERIDSSRKQVDGIAARAQRLQTIEAEADGRREVESLRDALDKVVSDLQSAETWLDSIEAVARGVESAASSIAQSQMQSQAQSQSQSRPAGPGGAHETDQEPEVMRGVRAAKVAEFSGDLADAVNRLNVLRGKLVEMRENRVLAREFAAATIAAAADLDTRLDNLSGRIDDFNGRVSKAQASSRDAGRRVHRWITFAAAATAAVLLWFAASQLCVLHRAWRLHWRVAHKEQR